VDPPGRPGGRRPRALRGLIHLGVATEEISDAALEITEGVMRDIGVHPVVEMAVQESDEIITRTVIVEGSNLDGTRIENGIPATDISTSVIAIRRPDEGWLVGHDIDTTLGPATLSSRRGPAPRPRSSRRSRRDDTSDRRSRAARPRVLRRARYRRLRPARYVARPEFVQRRPDRTFEGRGRFVAFMRDERPMTDTSHAVDAVYPDGPGVAVHGRLLDADGDEVFAFVDVFPSRTGVSPRWRRTPRRTTIDNESTTNYKEPTTTATATYK